MSVNTKETHGFQAEVKQLLHLVIHSLYSNKEIFLRELISNGSDALDKLRFLGLSDSKLYEDDSDLKIHVNFNEGARTITVRDNGIGMTRDDVANNLGTIAKSGTREFLANLSGDQAKDAGLIGQFGMGFYSVFIVADKVTVKTRRAGEAASAGVLWESTGEGEYVIENFDKPSRGTEIILHLKKDEIEFLNDFKLRSIITKYSDHISWPIIMMKPVEPEISEDDKEKPTEQKFEEETVNKATALWMRSKRDIKEEEYEEFYKHVSHDFETPMLWSHNQVEGKHEYTSLLYIPSHAPFDLWQPDVQHGLRLYVKRVFILDKVDQFLPRYLRFVKGIIDSSELPLNVSREILQDNKFVESIRSANVKRILSILSKLADDDKEKYAKFWKQFGLILKEGPIEDFTNKEKIAKLLRFSSTQSSGEEQDVSLEDYVSRMHKKQEKIYYIAAESLGAAKNSPHLEAFKERNIEVLLLHDRIDEWLVSHLSEFDGKHLQSVAKGEFELEDIVPKTEEEKKDEKKVEEDFDSLVKHVKEVLGDNVKEVRITHRLTSSPACIVADVHDMGREMQRMLEAAGQDIPKQKPIFEINPKHPIITRLNNETDDERFSEWAHILFDQSILAEGGKLDKPVEFVSRLNKMLLDLSS